MDTIEQLKEIGATFHISAAGGGTITISNICSVSGRSSVILGASFINDMDMFNKYIHVDSWSKYASYESAKELSVISQEYGKNGRKHFGVGIACSLAANNEREGRLNLANIVVTGYNFEISTTIHFSNDCPSTNTSDRRIAQEQSILLVVNQMIDSARLFILGYTVYLHSEYKTKYIKQHDIVGDSITIYPGSFNPIHIGHTEIKQISESITGNKTYLEISLINFDKKRINFDDLFIRTNKIGEDVVLSYNKTFVEKYKWLITNYPNLKHINFVCGIDTWDRISLEDKQYLNNMDNVKFLVFGRNCKWISDEEHKKYDRIIILHHSLIDYDNKISSSQIRNETR